MISWSWLLVSDLEAENNGPGLGIGADVDAPQGRVGTRCRNVRIESVVFLPEVEILTVYTQSQITDTFRFLVEVECVADGNTLQAQEGCIMNLQVTGYVCINTPGTRKIGVRVTNRMQESSM